MIRRFRHRGLRRLFEDGDRGGVDPQLVPKLRRMLGVLDKAKRPSDMNLPGYRLHQLGGNRRGEWAVWVTGNWRVVFWFDNEDAVGVNLEDYH
jgi:proteic killer suppression protein